jgi:hypothetical protein
MFKDFTHAIVIPIKKECKEIKNGGHYLLTAPCIFSG